MIHKILVHKVDKLLKLGKSVGLLEIVEFLNGVKFLKLLIGRSDLSDCSDVFNCDKY